MKTQLGWKVHYDWFTAVIYLATVAYTAVMAFSNYPYHLQLIKSSGKADVFYEIQWNLL